MNKKEITELCFENTRLMYCINSDKNKEYYILRNYGEQHRLTSGNPAPYYILYHGSIGSSISVILNIIPTVMTVTNKFIEHYAHSCDGCSETIDSFINKLKLFINKTRLSGIEIYFIAKFFSWCTALYLFPTKKQENGEYIATEPKALNIVKFNKAIVQWVDNTLASGYNNGHLIIESVAKGLIEPKNPALFGLLKIATFDADYYSDLSKSVYNDHSIDTVKHCNANTMSYMLSNQIAAPTYQTDLDLDILYNCELSSILYIILYHITEKKYCLKQCQNCNKYFLERKRTNAKYCDGISPQDKTKSCKVYAGRKTSRQNLKNDECRHKAKNVRDKLNNRMHNYPDILKYQAEYSSFIDQNIKWQKDVAQNTKTKEQYLEWLNTIQ